MMWYLAAILIFTYLINHLVLRFGFTELTYRMETDRRIYEIGDEIKLFSIIENRKPLTVSYLVVSEHFPKNFNVSQSIYSLFILPYQRVKRTSKLFANKRGEYIIDDVQLEIGDFIGLSIDKEKIDVEQDLIVLPQRIDLQASIAPIGSLSGDISVKRWIIDDPLMTIGIREYTGTEPQKQIHWPSSVKYGDLMVKNFDYTTESTVLVVLNIETMKPSWQPVEEDIIERSISLARAVMEELEENKIPYGFATNAYNERPENRGYFFHPGLGSHHLRKFLEILGKIHYRIPCFFENTLRDIRKKQGNYTTVVIITPRVLDTYIAPINLLSKAVSKTVVIAVEDEHMGALNKNILKYRGR